MVVSFALVICPDMYPRALGPNGPQAWVYISGKSLVPMIQLLNKYQITNLQHQILNVVQNQTLKGNFIIKY